MNIDITEKVLKYLDKKKIQSIVIDLISNETSPGWVGCKGTRRYYEPHVHLKNNNLNVDKYEVFSIFNVEVFLSKKIFNTKVEDITIDLEEVFFIKKLVLKNLSMILLWIKLLHNCIVMQFCNSSIMYTHISSYINA